MKLPLLIGATLVLGVTTAGAVVVRSAESALRTQALAADRHSVVAYADAVQSYLDGAAALLSVTVANPLIRDFALAGGPSIELRAMAARQAVPQREVAQGLLGSKRFEDVMLLRADGTVFLVEPYSYQVSLSAPRLHFLQWVAQVRTTWAPVISGLHISPSTQQPAVVVATPIIGAEGRLAGIWAGSLDLRQLAAVSRASGSAAGASSYGLVTDARGLVIAHQADPSHVEYQSDFRGDPPVARALRGISGAGEWRNPFDDEMELGAYVPLGGTGWTVVYATRKASALAPAHALARTIVVYAAALVLLLAVAAHLVLRWGLRPLEVLTGAARKIAAGDEADPFEVGARDEVGTLASAFATMQHRLRAREADVTRHAQRLEVANEELESFAYSVSHDLRTPLRAIEGFGTILQEDYASSLEPEATALLHRVRAAATRMGALIDDLLELSRVGRAELRVEQVDLSGLCEESLRELAAAAPGRVVRAAVEPGIVLHGDPRLLRVVVDNLLGNAWKFTEGTQDARIEVSSVRAEGGPGACIRDNGVGFDMSDAGKLFGAFQRLHAASEFPGTGIGLATVQRIVHRHGGGVSAWSEPGRGASFVFCLGPELPDRTTSEQGGTT